MTRTRQVYHRKGAFHRENKAWGDIVTADHIDCRRYEMIGINDERQALIVLVIYSGMVQVYPVSSNSTETTVEDLRHFKGIHDVKLFYPDGARALCCVSTARHCARGLHSRPTPKQWDH